MSHLDHMIPSHIIDMMDLNSFEFSLILDSTSANGAHPRVSVKVDDVTIYDDVVGTNPITFSTKSSMHESNVEIFYYNKTQSDTVVGPNGEILEDQSVTIKSMTVNGVDIVSSGIIYNLGHFHPKLSAEKQQFYKTNGIDAGPSHTLNLHDNGHWELKFKFPVITNFVKLKAFQETHEKWPDNELLNAIYDTISRIGKSREISNGTTKS
jgi:hypothetical protein